MYATLRRHRAALRDDGGPLAALRACPVRYLHRDNREYASLLLDRSSPGYLALPAALEARQHQLNLTRGIAEDARVLPFEVAALRQGNIPDLTAGPTARLVWSHDCAAPVGEILGSTGWERCVQTLQALSPAHLEAQCQRIREALAPNEPRTEP